MVDMIEMSDKLNFFATTVPTRISLEYQIS
jgi:hypothetical protein